MHALVCRNADQSYVETANEMHAYYACGNASNVNANAGGNYSEMCGFAWSWQGVCTPFGFHKKINGFAFTSEGVLQGISLAFRGFVSILQGVPLRTVLELHGFTCMLKGVLLGVSLNFFQFASMLPGSTPRDFMGAPWVCVFFARWVHVVEAWNFNKFASVLELVTPKVSTYFQRFTSSLQGIRPGMSFVSRGLAFILQRVLPIDLIGCPWSYMHVARDTSLGLHWICLDLHLLSKGHMS